MHEWALAEAVIVAAAQTADREHLEAVSVIRVRLGEAQRISRDVFESSLREILAREAPRLRGARAEIETEPALYKCRGCASEWGLGVTLNMLNEEESEAVHFIPEMARVYARCPDCSSPDFDLVAGRGIWLVSVTGVN
jgi:hydrogenase nickel incorporation protein HypA/HybF